MPKSLVKIKNLSILSRQIHMIPIDCVKEILIIVGFEQQQIRDEMLRLKVPFPVRFIENDNYQNSNCGFSFSLTKDQIEGPIIYINSDLIIEPNSLQTLLNDTSENSLLVNINESQHQDFLKGIINKDGIMHFWPETGYGDTGNCIIVGPFKMSHKTHHFICNQFDNLNYQDQSSISCYGLFSKALMHSSFVGIHINAEHFWEIDTYADLTHAEETIA